MKNGRLKSIGLAGLLALTSLPLSASAQDCFNFGRLPRSLQARADQILEKALDSEALYTVAIDLKPMSSEFVTLASNGSPREEAELKNHALILQAFHCTPENSGEIFSELIPFLQKNEGRTQYSPILLNRRAFDELMRREHAFFSSLGDVLDSREKLDPKKVITAVEASTSWKRFYGYGLLHGYPKDAVEFFIRAAKEEENSGRFVPRDFVSIPTFSSAAHMFVWAVPVGHQLSPEELEMKRRAAPIFEEYLRRRAASLSLGETASQLVRHWLLSN